MMAYQPQRSPGQNKNKELHKEVTALKDKLSNAVSKEEIASVEGEKYKLINEKDREVRQLKREKENLQREIDESRAEEREKYEQQLASARDEYTHLEAEKRQALDQLQNEKERYRKLSVHLSTVTSELEQGRKQLQHMKNSSVNDNSEIDDYIQEISTEITGLTEDIAKKGEEIKRQQEQIKQLAKERDEAVTKFTSLQEEFRRKELRVREENQRKIKEYIDAADHWRIQYETAQENLGSERHAREKEANAVDAGRCTEKQSGKPTETNGRV